MLLIGLIFSLPLLLGLYLLGPWIVRDLMRWRFLARMRRSGARCLTFDDGPHPVSTPQILALLNAAGVRATFFVLGRQVERHPELLALMARAGHEIGVHGYAHRHAWKSAPWAYLADLRRGQRAVQAALRQLAPGVRVRTFRPPFGKFNLLTLWYLFLARQRVAFWNVDPRDYAQSSAEAVAHAVLEQWRPGSVILLHDGRIREGGDPAVTVEAVRLLLEQAGARGLRFMTLSAALAANVSGGRWIDHNQDVPGIGTMNSQQGDKFDAKSSRL